ncbi:MAG: 3-phosphoshikimate 1-carboxyvinyltransferase [Aquificaceae bacterium]|jgi:3-phosphoshikimate 1-carboxyvinyltransferase|nr:3-phosphoshikimate 1-carboxyvinyltransferase [Aquificaceae bacterium]MDM7266957.1 3-phosphoshikimate 1-carboxyvinyltransferase [Aquificaceae bacterium]QWK12703.1 MAG: 3-phosphoshikimate 1-carboxyvinyltransferase [Aquificota bacterium]
MLKLSKAKRAKGELRVPSDKSISHRAVIFSALAEGESYVKEWLSSEDTLATLNMLIALGVEVKKDGKNLRIKGRDYSFVEPSNVLDAKNSGTTARLMLGVLSTQPFFSVITGDESLRQRPMLRVVEPLRQMGAYLDGREKGNKLPVCVRGGSLKGISFFNKKSSAQVKSALLLAGLRAEGYTEVVEPVLSRDHTERMLKAFGVELIQMEGKEGHVIKLKGGQRLVATEVFCPADPSSASFFVALAVLLEGSELLLKDVLVNPTRDGFFRKLKDMGADIRYENLREISGEPVADLYVRYSGKLKAVEVLPEEVPSMIDELPILAVVMALSEGVSRVKGAQELRVKESDRIRAVVENLRAMGVKAEEYEDGFEIEGVEVLKGASIKTFGDHRIAMAFSIAGLLAEGETIIDNPECVAISYPNFYKDLEGILEG